MADEREPRDVTLYTRDGIRIPGTHYLVDVEHLDHKASTDAGGIVLIPTPSDDPDDPLNWSPRRKALASFCWVLYTITNGIAGSNLSSVLVPFSEASGLSPSILNAGTGYLFLLAGWSLLFWQPVALQYGKRPVYLVSLLGLTGMSLWAPFIRSPGLWYARSILTGFFAAPVEALPELSVTHLYFTHQRGTYMALYAFALVGSNFFSPFICGFINAGQGYPWVFYWPAIFCFAAALVLLVAMEETNFSRPPNSSRSPSPPTPPSRRFPLRLLTPSPHTTLLATLATHLTFFTFPLALYAGFAYGTTLIWFSVLNATASSLLSAPPYFFPSTSVALAYLAPLLGSLAALALTAFLSDRLALRLARTRAGLFEPEHRLRLLALPTALIPAALLLWGVGAAQGLPWPALVVAMALLGFNNATGAAVAVAYAVDCYREAAAEALVVVVAVRNTMSFAIGYGINPWIEGMGLRDAFVTAALVGMAISALCGVVVWRGRAEREHEAARYWRVCGRRGDGREVGVEGERGAAAEAKGGGGGSDGGVKRRGMGGHEQSGLPAHGD